MDIPKSFRWNIYKMKKTESGNYMLYRRDEPIFCMNKFELKRIIELTNWSDWSGDGKRFFQEVRKEIFNIQIRNITK